MSQFGPANQDMIDIAKDIRGMTQKALAEASGVPERKLSRYLRGLEEPAREDVALIAEALEFPVNFFYMVGKRGPKNPWADVCRRGL